MVQAGGAADCAGAAGLQHGPHLPQCGNPAHVSGIRLASNRAGEALTMVATFNGLAT